ncbi:Rhodanese-related sulfurtransferase [Sediminibacterium ginsengisoli]|uniref:Rhodanese-related sulfurtransferase n=2 Tax=Sediminibacterium ginsengisoli TaxID=413434 RepID=A0A1T4KU54_9BACT|nr:Rhodanese-related sulfurtransferase [Sediminibacterium ginsengisoli]
MPSATDGLPEIISNGALLVDVRTPAEFAVESVPGAINIPLNCLQSQLQQLRGRKSIVVFCRSGNRSSQAKSILEQHGFQHVINGYTWQNVQQCLTHK